MQVRRSVAVAVGVSIALVVALVGFAIARDRARRDDLLSPFVAEAERNSMRAVAEEQARPRPLPVDQRNETVAQTAERLDHEDALIDRIAGDLNGDNVGTASGRRSRTDANGIALPAGGVAVVSSGQRLTSPGTPDAVQRDAQNDTQQWSVPYAETDNGEWGIGGYAPWGLPLNVSDFVQNAPVTANGNSGQQAALVPPDPTARPAQSQPEVRETPPGGAAISPPAPGAANTPQAAQPQNTNAQPTPPQPGPAIPKSTTTVSPR